MFNNNKAFTLIEVLIATTILAAMAVSMSQVMGGIVDTKNKSSSINERHHVVQLTIDKIKTDLRLAFIADSKFDGSDKKFITGFKGEAEAINFSTMSNLHFMKNKKESDQVHVGYLLEKNDSGYYNLSRRKTDYLLDDLEKGGKSFALLSNVKEVKFEFYDSNKEEWKKEWDTGSVSYAGRLPKTVKVTLTLENVLNPDEDNERKEEAVYEFQVPIALYKTQISF